jgi:hypothetical protein
MSKKLKAIFDKYVHENEHRLSLARDRAESVRTNHLNLGESLRAELLAATMLPTPEAIIDSAVVVAKLKRGALIKIADLLYYCNKWGVMMCTVPAHNSIGGLNGIGGPDMWGYGKEAIFEKLGVTRKHSGSSEYIHDYSNCDIPKQSALTS